MASLRCTFCSCSLTAAFYFFILIKDIAKIKIRNIPLGYNLYAFSQLKNYKLVFQILQKYVIYCTTWDILSVISVCKVMSEVMRHALVNTFRSRASRPSWDPRTSRWSGRSDGTRVSFLTCSQSDIRERLAFMCAVCHPYSYIKASSQPDI